MYRFENAIAIIYPLAEPLNGPVPVGIDVEGYKEIGLFHVGDRRPPLQRQKRIRSPGKVDLTPQLLSNLVRQYLGDFQDDVLLLRVPSCVAPRIFPSVTGVNDDGLDAQTQLPRQ